jgi:hypothetical protein
VDADTWYGDGGSVTWHVGPAPPVVIVRNRIEGWIPPVPELQHQLQSRFPACREPETWAEVIDERHAAVTSVVCEGKYQTIVVWEWPALRFHGEANRASTAEVHRSVYRTVQFSRPPR